MASPKQQVPGRRIATGSPGDPLGALQHFEASLAGVRAGLVDIQESPSYIMLTDPGLGGETARRYGAAARDGADLWPLMDAVGAQLAQARSHQDQKGSGGANGTELRRLLQERLVPITTLSGVEARRYSVQEILELIRRRYQAIRAGVTEVDQLWVAVLPRVDSARATLKRLASEADDLGVIEPLIGRAQALADDLASRLVSDPASVTVQDGSNLDLQVAKAAKQMAELRTGHDALDEDFGGTEELLASLRVLRARAAAARAEAEHKIVNPDGLVMLPSEQLLDGPDGMARRLDDLFATAATAAWTQKRTLLDAWLSAARKLERQLIRAGDANRAPLEARNELRGRLQAYSAKIAATGRAEDIGLADLVDRARDELYTAPTDLERAEAAIAELATRLRT